MGILQGYKTIIWNAIKIICGALIAAGVMTPEMQDTLLNSLDDIVGGGLIVISIVDLILRKVSTTPMGNILKKLFGA